MGVRRTRLVECLFAIRGGPPGPHNDDGVEPSRSGLSVIRPRRRTDPMGGWALARELASALILG